MDWHVYPGVRNRDLRIIVNHDFPRPGGMTVARRPWQVVGIEWFDLHQRSFLQVD